MRRCRHELNEINYLGAKIPVPKCTGDLAHVCETLLDCFSLRSSVPRQTRSPPRGAQGCLVAHVASVELRAGNECEKRIRIILAPPPPDPAPQQQHEFALMLALSAKTSANAEILASGC
jgi:hypothetical protein